LGAVTRASDGERERALVALHRSYAAGRLDAVELEERVARVTRATYRHELRALLADLPRDVGARAAGAVVAVDRAALRWHGRAFFLVAVALVATWALTGAGAFWPAWVVVPWGAVVAFHAWCSRALRRVLRAPRRRAA
jgi:hypothetical protein